MIFISMVRRAPVFWFALAIGCLALAPTACVAPTPLPSAAIANATVAATAVATPASSNPAQPHVDAARGALKAGKYTEAAQEAQAAIQADAKNAQAQYLLGNAYNQMASGELDGQKRQDDLAKAVDAYLIAIKLDPKNDAAFTNLATVYYQNGQFDEAQKNVEQALALKPDDPTSHYVLGTIHLQRDPKKFPDAQDKAQAEFEAALKYDANMGAAYIGLANVYLFKGDNSKALEDAQKGIDLLKDTPNPFAYWALAQAQCAGGDKAGTAITIDKINSFNLVDPLFKQQVETLQARCK